jgi:hypothetical protein
MLSMIAKYPTVLTPYSTHGAPAGAYKELSVSV